MTDQTNEQPKVTNESLFARLRDGKTNYDFVGKTRVWFAISGILIVIFSVSLMTRQLNGGIDFTGGTAWELPAGAASVDDARATLAKFGQDKAKIQTLGDDHLRIQVELKGKTEAEVKTRSDITDALAELTGAKSQDISVSEVSATWGASVTSKAIRALIIFFILVAIYISIRFLDWKMAAAALIAVVHDILITAGVYSLFGFEVAPGTVVAFLTILGFSLYDTIVVFDKVQENTSGALAARGSYEDAMNLSLNQVVMRSINTSVVALLPISCVLFIGAYVLGAATLEEFGLALFVGLIAGTYSSLFIASPVLVLLKRNEARFAGYASHAGASGSGSTTSRVSPKAQAPVRGRASMPTPPLVIEARPRKGAVKSFEVSETKGDDSDSE